MNTKTYIFNNLEITVFTFNNKYKTKTFNTQKANKQKKIIRIRERKH